LPTLGAQKRLRLPSQQNDSLSSAPTTSHSVMGQINAVNSSSSSFFEKVQREAEKNGIKI